MMEKETYLEKAFTRLNAKVDNLYQMKDEKKHVFFIEWHKYSPEELFHSREYESIISAVEKIADDINYWKENNELGIGIRNTYNVNRDLLEDRLLDFNDAIEHREPTVWEKIGNFFRTLVAFVVNELPKLWNGLMLAADKFKDVKIIGPACKWLISFDKTIRNHLVSKDKKYISEVSNQ